MLSNEIIKPIKDTPPDSNSSPEKSKRRRRAPFIALAIAGAITMPQVISHWGEEELLTNFIIMDKRPSQPPAAPVPKGTIIPSAYARNDIPPAMLEVYINSAASKPNIDWVDVASLGKRESNHGRSPLPGVRSGLNSANCCAGPLQFNVMYKEGADKKTTWERWGGDFNKDGQVNVYDYRDAIPAATNLYAHLVNKFHDKVLAAAAYNAGEGKVIESGGVPNIKETQEYVIAFKEFQKKYKG